MSEDRKCSLCGKGFALTGDGPWRVGKHYGIHVYEGDRPVATFHRIEDARRAVAAVASTCAADADTRPEDHGRPQPCDHCRTDGVGHRDDCPRFPGHHEKG